MRKFEKVSYNDTGIIPTRSDNRSAGYDLYSPNAFSIGPNELVKIETNIKCQLEENDVLMIYPRSSIGIKKNIMLANTTGVIDSSYYNNESNEGNIIIALYNYGNKTQHFDEGDRIAQAVIIPFLTVDNDIVIGNKRIGGIGSSGK